MAEIDGVHNANRGEIIIYRAEDNTIQLDVRMENETVWLTQKQIAELFGVKKAAVSKHIANIFSQEELNPVATVSKMETVQIEGKRTIVRYLDFYNLDMILSIGYRVNSKRAIAFRQWSSKILKEFIVKGYAINEKLRREQLSDLRQLVQIVGRTMQSKSVESEDETQAIFDVVLDYTYALDTLDNYDYERLTVKETTPELYPSVEEKAAMLLYLVTKNHSFSDGNKRIAATLFLWFLNNNGILYREDGTKRLADNTLVALTLMIAESRTEEKDTMVKVVVNLINQKN